MRHSVAVSRFPARHRVTEVEEAADRPVAAAFHRLAEVDGLGELPELLDDLGGDVRNAHRRGHLQLDDRDLGVDEGVEAGADVLELDGLVADVEDDAEVAPQRGGRIHLVDTSERRQPGRRGVGEQLFTEVADRLLGRLHVAERLRLEAQPHRRPRRPGQLDEMGDDAAGRAR